MVVLGGQTSSVGVAKTAAAAYLARSSSREGISLKSETKGLEIKDLLLETPFTSVHAMILKFYPQKWLPYRHLHSFLWNHWDRRQALSRIATSRTKPKVPILQAGEDGLVPRAYCSELQDGHQAGKTDVELVAMKGALHREVTAKPHEKAAAVDFFSKLGEDG